MHHGTPPQLSPAPCRLRCLSSIPSRPCCYPSSSSTSSTCSSSSSSRSLRLSSCCCSSTCCCSSCSSGCSGSSCSDGRSCVCIFGVSSFQGFHSFLLISFINKQTNKSFLQNARVQKAFQTLIY